MAVAVADLDGHILASRRFPTQAAQGPQTIIRRIIREVEDLVSQTGGKPMGAVGVGCGGPLDPASGVILSPPNLPGWDQIPLGEMLSQALQAPVYVDNDANAAALGEYRFGAGAGREVFVYMTISTGIGGGIVIDGSLLHGVGAGAGEIGHQTVLPNGPLCNCGNRGCLEALASGTPI
ncbi:MAG: ROK family protein, partial [Chloroflexi bacterium]|nr:ROK family protein [Chloroflexota bacterium]